MNSNNNSTAGEEAKEDNGPEVRAGTRQCRKKKTAEELLNEKVVLNESLGSKLFCWDSNHKKDLSCSCLRILHGRRDYCQAVGEFQVMFDSLSFTEKKKVVIEWMRNLPDDDGGNTIQEYRIPYILHANADLEQYQDLRNKRICVTAMRALLGKGRDWWKSCVDHHKSMTLPNHKLTGKISNKKRKFLGDFQEQLEEHFEELQREAEPIATRYVREVTGETSLRDDQDDLLFLPPYLTVRGCYAKFCFEKRGVKITTTNKGNVKKAAAAGEGEPKSVPSWQAYVKYWKEKHPLLKVRKPTEDICSYCYKFYNLHKFRSNTPPSTEDDATTDAADSGSGSIEARVDLDSEDEETQQQHKDGDATTDLSDAAVGVEASTALMEKAILEAADHVKRARAMRTFVNEKIETYTFIADFCQNMELPYFGKEQPGDTYYLTPSKLEGFGVADVSKPKSVDGNDADHLYFHCYKEGYGAKGGINVASMIMKTLQLTSVLKKDSFGRPIKGGELNIVMDNCGGQNKNNYVLLLAPYLAEMGFFATVNMVFLVVGHTKNVCDRRFNDLKRTYHNSQVFTLAEAVNVLSKSAHVTVWPIDPLTDWKDYDTMLQVPYVKLQKRKLKIKVNHIFSASADSSNVIRFSTRISSLPEHPPVYADIRNEAFAVGKNRLKELRLLRPLTVIYKGLPGYKQILLHKNYISFVPKQYHNDALYQQPSAEVLKAEEEERGKERIEKLTKR